VAETFVGVQAGYDDPTMRQDSGESETADASSFDFAGEEPLGTDPTGTLTLVNYLGRYMGDTTYGSELQERK